MVTEATADTGLLAWLVDQHIVELTGAELKVLLFIVRWTLGAGQDTAAIGYAQFSDGTGVTDRATLAKALTRLEQRTLIARVHDQGRAGKGSSATRYRVMLEQGEGNPTLMKGNPTVMVPAVQVRPVPSPVMPSPTTVLNPAPDSDALSRRVWDAVAFTRVLHRHQVDALRSITVRDWDAEHLVLAPASAAEERLAWAHKRDLERFLARVSQIRCVVEILPPASEPTEQGGTRAVLADTGASGDSDDVAALDELPF